ncbi:MAG: hypothetical protein IJ523_06245 [Succinivibrionaceae bacterium]|nr:hypothetical protein [Succinivibrionaceae bacterium]
MLIGFSAENFRCYDGEINASLIAENNDRNCFYVGQVPVISHMAVCGKSSSGKTSLLSILTLISDIAAEGKIPGYASGWYNRLDRSNRSRDTTLEIIFSCDATVYSYGLKANLADGVIRREWINELASNGTSLLLMGRDEDNSFTLARSDAFSKDDHQRFRLYAEDLAPCQSLLHKLSGVSFREDSGLHLFRNLQKYLSSFVTRACGPGVAHSMKLWVNQDNLIFDLHSMLSTFGSDISGIIVKSAPLPRSVDASDLARLEGSAGLVVREKGSLYLIGLSDSGETETSQLIFEHSFQNRKYRLSYADESSSSRRLVDLALLFISSPQQEDVILIDDIHQRLSAELLTNLFSYIDFDFAQKNRQVIFTTEDSEEVYPVYCLEAQNIFHAARDDRNGYVLLAAHPDGAGEDVAASDSQNFEYEDGSETDRQSDSEFDGVGFAEEEIPEDYRSSAADLCKAKPLDDNEAENWSENGSGDYHETVETFHRSPEPQEQTAAADDSAPEAENAGDADAGAGAAKAAPPESRHEKKSQRGRRNSRRRDRDQQEQDTTALSDVSENAPSDDVQEPAGSEDDSKAENAADRPQADSESTEENTGRKTRCGRAAGRRGRKTRETESDTQVAETENQNSDAVAGNMTTDTAVESAADNSTQGAAAPEQTEEAASSDSPENASPASPAEPASHQEPVQAELFAGEETNDSDEQ